MSNVNAGSDILNDAIFTVSDSRPGAERLSLADLLARLLTGPQVVGFPRLAAEQRGHWWRFLVRCAAKSLHTSGLTVEESSRQRSADLAVGLRNALRMAAGDPDGSDGVWVLHQPDASRPGFLQPPIPNGAVPGEAKYALNSMSLLTSAIGSKNHERKVEITRELDAELTAYALIELQLGAIFGGRGNYGSQIMGSASGAGSGSPFMGVRLGEGEDETFRHDVGVLLASWDRIREDHALRGDVWALWTVPWDGESSLPSSRLDPAFIPLARLIRLGSPDTDGKYSEVWFRASNKARVDDLSGGGNLGDPFTPLVPDLKNPDIRKVRGALDGGYGYAEVTNLLFGADSRRPGTVSPSVRAASVPLLDGRSDVRVVFEGTAFEQGKTVGFYRREILLPPSAKVWLSDEPSAVMREVHRQMLGWVREVKSVLNGAARILLSGEPRPRDGDAGKIALPADRFDALVDRDYLEHLLTGADREIQDDATWRGEWTRHLAALAVTSFRETRDAIPTATASRYEREVRATDWLEFRLRRIRVDAGDPESTFPSPEPQEVVE